MQNVRLATRPLLRPALVVLALVLRSVTAAAAPDHPIAWGRYERTPQVDGTLSACFQHRQGFQAIGPERVNVFQILNDCGRALRAQCSIAYTPSCSYGADVEQAGRFDAVIEAHAAGSVFGAFRVSATGKVAGCFFVRCGDAKTAVGSAPETFAAR